MKKYKFNYDYFSAECEFEVDLSKFTKEKAQATLDFFSWDYDIEANPIDEVLKKYAILVLEKSNQYLISHVKTHQFEGFCVMDGSEGIKLTTVVEYEFDIEQLQMVVVNID